MIGSINKRLQLQVQTMSTVSYEENWAWVDQRLEELYYGYGLTAENCDDYMEAGLLSEMWSSVDENLEKQYNADFEGLIPCPAPITWVLYKNYEKQSCLEEAERTRSRAESDISDHSDTVERILKQLALNCALADETESLVSSNWEMDWEIDLEMEREKDDCSESSSLMMEIDDGDGYDSF